MLLYAVDAPSDCPELDPPTTRVVNAAIELFALALPLQPPKVQESCLEQLATFVAQPLQREPGRRIGVNINIFTALLGALMVANRETVFSSGQITASGVDRITAEILRVSLQVIRFGFGLILLREPLRILTVLYETLVLKPWVV